MFPKGKALKKTGFRGLVAAIATIFLIPVLLITGCGKGGEDARLKISASIVPVADFCKRIGGDNVEVRTLVPPGAGCGHAFEPTARDMRFLSESKVLVLNGLELESWATDVLGKATGRNIVKVDLSDSLSPERLIKAGGSDDVEDSGHDHHHGAWDPHTWLDPTLVIYEVGAIRDAFVKVDPANKDAYEKNAAAFIEELIALDEELASRFASLSGGKFISTHHTWSYFAKRYGLVQVGELEEYPGKEPSAQRIAGLITLMRDQEVRVALAEAQTNRKPLETVCSEIGTDVVLVDVDPIGDPGKTGYSDYLTMMRTNAAAIAAALR